MTSDESPAELISELCKQFYHLGWVTGTGGGMSIREKECVYIAPSAVQKERLKPQDIFILDFKTRCVLHSPKTAGLRLSQCTPLFWCCYTERPTTQACIHTHSIHAVLLTLLYPQSTYVDFTHLEMIKGLIREPSPVPSFYSYHDTLRIPIINNTAYERDLEESLREALRAFPNAPAVLVRRHGLYVWGESWEQAKTMCECLDYLFQCSIEMKKLGMDPSCVPEGCQECELNLFK